MAQLTISAAARLCHMDRRTLQRAIHAGRLHLDAPHCLSTDELILTGYLLTNTPQGTPQEEPQAAPQEPPQTAPHRQEMLTHEAPQLRSLRGEMCRRIVAFLREHPEGLSPSQIRDQLGTDRDLNEVVASFVNRSNLLKSWEKTETCEGSTSGAYGPKTRRSRAFPPHTRPRSPTIFLTAPRSYDTVALHL